MVRRLSGTGATSRWVLICATAIVGVVPAQADELSDIKAQVRLLQQQNQALTHRINQIGRTQGRTGQGGDAGRQGVGNDKAGSQRQGGAGRAGARGQGIGPGYQGGSGDQGGPGYQGSLGDQAGRGGQGRSGSPQTGADPDSANATSSGNSGVTTGVPTVQEQRTATAAPASASIGGTPPIPSAGGLTYLGVTLYGGVDLGVAYQTHGTPLNSQFAPGLEYQISRNSNRSQVSLAPNALSYSNVGLKGTEPILPGLSGVFNLQTSFSALSGQLSSGPGSQVQNNGVALNRQSSNGDSSRDGQALTANAYLGLSSLRYGTITFGRQNAFTLDGVVAYDPMFASNAFSVIGFQGAVAGGGDTEDARLDSSVKYLVNYGPIHGGAMYQLAGGNGKSVNPANSGGRGTYQFDVGGEYGGLNVDAIYSQVYDAVATAPLTAAQVPMAPAGSLAATVSDNTAFLLLGKYKIDKLQLFIGYENILYSAPRNPLGVGSTSTGGFALSVVNNAAYTNNRLLQIYWGGARYAVSRRFSVDVAYYRQHQNSYSGNGCANNSLSSCRGDLNAYSLLLDYRLSPRFDLYAGAMLSTASNGLASGFLYNTSIDPTIGARFAF